MKNNKSFYDMSLEEQTDYWEDIESKFCDGKCSCCGYWDNSIPHDSYSESNCCTRKEGEPFPKPVCYRSDTTKICVYGLWHLGLVTSACLADKGYDIVGVDSKHNVYDINIKSYIDLPIYEPNLKELISSGLKNKNLSFTDDMELALKDTDIIWVTFDTPVDKNDKADYEYVYDKIRETYKYLRSGMIVIISSQLLVGSTRKLYNEFKELYPEKDVTFIYSPENLRRGKGIYTFKNQERLIVGINKKVTDKIYNLFHTISPDVIFMNTESAEMVKHALNSFLAMSISFANEVNDICEKVGADYLDVEISLKKDERIGMKSYIRSGEPYSGGTLSRDVAYLSELGKKLNIDIPLIKSINESNNNHKEK